MNNALAYTLILIAFTGIYPLFAQQTTQFEYVKEGTEEHVRSVLEKGGELKEDLFEKLDSLSEKSSAYIQNAGDSLDGLSSKIEDEVRSKIDSLQQKLDALKSTGTKRMDSTAAKAQKITARIDSLQKQITDKLQLDRLRKDENPLANTNLADRLQLPDISGKSIPNLGVKPGMDKLSLPDYDLNALSDQVDERLGKFSDLGNSQLLKTDLPDVTIPDEVKPYTELLNDPSTIDQSIDSRAAQMAEAQDLIAKSAELDAMKELPASMQADLERFQIDQAKLEADKIKEEAKDMAIQKAQDYFAQHQDKLQAAQSQMSKLKKKYSYVPDSRDLSTAVKANSLQNEPLKKRLRFGLGFQIQRTNPISLDLSPNLQYRFNKLFSAGISGSYRISLGIENKSAAPTATAEEVYGGSLLAQHKVWKGFFGHAEFQYLSKPMVDPTSGTDLSTRSWHEGLLLGIGKQMSLAKGLHGQVIFTYDFLHTAESPAPKAWNVKFGFQLAGFKVKDVKL